MDDIIDDRGSDLSEQQEGSHESDKDPGCSHTLVFPENLRKYSLAQEEEKLQESKIYQDIKSELMSHSSEPQRLHNQSQGRFEARQEHINSNHFAIKPVPAA